MVVNTHSVTFGPDHIQAIRFAFDSLLPWLTQSQFRILNTGALEFDSPEPVDAINVLRQAVEDILPDGLTAHLGERSGLGWDVFFAHVVGWWLPQRHHIGFLRAFVDRVALHDVELKLHWNQNLILEHQRLRPGNESLVWGTVLGVVCGILGSRFFHFDTILSLLMVAAGLVGGRIYQRVTHLRICGDRLCRGRLGRGNECPYCGAGVV